MAISRPLLVVLIGALLLLAGTTAVRALGNSGGDAPASPTVASDTGSGASSTRASGAKAREPSGQAAAKEARKAAKAEDPQTPVLRALAARKVVVLFFGQYRSADDQATRRAVRAVGRENKDVAVFAASIKDVSDYARVVAALGIQQSPSTIVIDRSGQARLVEGFLDKGSLRQLVADARS